jgi:hypothetical protein
MLALSSSGRFLIAIFWVALASPCFAENPSHRLLPEELRLTLAEDQHSTLPLDPGCEGLAGASLTCRALILTLENDGSRTIRIGEICSKPSITIELRMPKFNTGWWPVSRPKHSPCSSTEWTNVRLRPGERTQYSTRLRASDREFESFMPPGATLPATYLLRARWTLASCKEIDEGTDCFAPPESARPAGATTEVALREPAEILSNEFSMTSPELVGEFHLSFEVKALSDGPERHRSGTDSADPRQVPIIDVQRRHFHYTIHNLGADPIMISHNDCGDDWIKPEYRPRGGDWRPIPRIPGPFDYCTLNAEKVQEILPGRTAEGDFSLATLSGSYSTAELNGTGGYQLRFGLLPHACVAPPDESYCVARLDKQEPVLSNEIHVRSGTFRGREFRGQEFRRQTELVLDGDVSGQTEV